MRWCTPRFVHFALTCFEMACFGIVRFGIVCFDMLRFESRSDAIP